MSVVLEGRREEEGKREGGSKEEGRKGKLYEKECVDGVC